MPFIPIAAPSLGAAELAAATTVLVAGRLVQGEEVAAFETEFSALVDGRSCVAVSSGTSALHLMLVALDIGLGDEVILPSFTFAATANAVRLAGAIPVFADIRAEDFALDPDDVAARIGPRTAAVLTVHLYGQTGDMDALGSVCARAGIALLEDAAQAHGAGCGSRSAGAWGTGAAFSFYATKNMTTGEGGMVVLADEDAARRVRLLRNQGMLRPHENEIVGLNARMTEVAAAIGRVQLGRLPALTAARARNAGDYDRVLAGVDGLLLPPVLPGRHHVWHQYTVRVEDRDDVARRLRERGIDSGLYYRTPVHRLPAYADPVELPATQHLAARVLSLPVHPGVPAGTADRVADALADPPRRRNAGRGLGQGGGALAGTGS